MTDAVQPNSQLASEVAEAEARAEVLLTDPGLLRRYVEASRDLGLVGEERNVAILKLALVSRVLERPVNVVVKGPSSGGKNFLIETALRLEDRSAYEELTVASEKYLAYTDTDLKHRFIYMPEAAVMGGWGAVGLSIMRSLIWGNRVSIGTVETKQGSRRVEVKRKGRRASLSPRRALWSGRWRRGCWRSKWLTLRPRPELSSAASPVARTGAGPAWTRRPGRPYPAASALLP